MTVKKMERRKLELEVAKLERERAISYADLFFKLCAVCIAGTSLWARLRGAA